MIAIIIPCYNESKRLKIPELDLLAKHPNIVVYLANDGSTDTTQEVIETYAKTRTNVIAIQYEKNEGKAQTIFKTIHQLKNNKKIDYIGYLDADFATDATQFIKLINNLLSSNKSYIFGSRIATLSSHIKRSVLRHYIGRIVITLLNLKYKLGIYDSQCGAKLFSKEIINEIASTPFYTNWLFDIEIFLRLKDKNLLYNGIEFPLEKWEDISGSKITSKEIRKILLDFYKLHKNY